MQHVELVFHVFLATLGFGMAIGIELVLVAVTRTGRSEAIRTAYQATQRFRPLVGVSLILAILLGFLIAFQNGISLVAPWLLVTYGLLVVNGAVYAALVQRRARKILSDENVSPASPIAAITFALVMFLIVGAMIR